MRHKKNKKICTAPEVASNILLAKTALCPLSDSRLILVGVVVIIVECKLCASVPTEQQLVTGGQKLARRLADASPAANEKEGRGHFGPLFISELNCNITFSKSQAPAKSFSPTFE